MKFLRYCLLCLFVMRVQSKPQITKLFPVEGLMAYQKQLSNATKPLEKFFEKLRATYNFVFHQHDNTSYIEKILGKAAPNPGDLQSLRIIWTDTTKTDNFTNLKYPNNTLFDQVKSLSMLQNRENKTNSSSFENNSTEVKSTIKINATKNASRTSSSEKSPNKIKTLPNDDLFNDIEPLDQLKLQDELDDKNEVEITTSRPATLGNHLTEWIESFFSLTSGIYAKLTGVVCGK